MMIKVIVKSNAKENKLEPIEKNLFKALVKDPAQEGKANQAVIKLLANQFNTTQKQITLKAGRKAKNKVFNVSG